MSGTLSFRKTPKKWNGSFQYPLRDKIADHISCYGVTTIDHSEISYFKGLKDACDNKSDIEDLNKIIEILESGDTVDFKMEF